MNKFRSSFLSAGLLLVLASPVLQIAAENCGDCNTDRSCSSNTSCGSCGNSDCNGCSSSNSCGSCSNSDCNGCGSCGDTCSTSTLCGSCGPCPTVLLGRSAHDNTAYRWLPFAFHPDSCEFSGGFTLGFEFQQTFKDRDLARCLFGGRSTLEFKGSSVANRGNAILADNFGLSPFFQGSISFCPQIRNYNLHFESLWQFNNWLEGLYLRADLTFSHQERRLFADSGCCACPTDTLSTSTLNSTPFPAGYMAGGTSTTAVATTSILTALGGQSLFGDMQTPWKFGRFSSCKLDDNKVAGFSIDLGYNFWLCEDSHLGIFIRYSAPTGTKLDGSQKNAAFFFAPIIGNGHYNELGGGLTAHKELWANECGDSISVYLDGYATHLFDTCQVRSFDFLGKGCLSRYMLLKGLTPSSDVFPTGGESIGFAYDGSLINGINFATRNVRSSISVQGDASLRFIYQHNNFYMSLGYNAFGRAREDVCLKAGTPCNAIAADSHYGFKGCAPVDVFSFAVTGSVVDLTGTGIQPSNLTQSDATICACGTNDHGVSSQVALSGAGTGTIFLTVPIAPSTSVAVLSDNGLIADVSVPAVEVVADATTLDVQGGRIPRLFTNKGFITMDYVWDRCEWSPYIGIGGEVEGGSRCCDIKQWGVWLKGGFSF